MNVEDFDYDLPPERIAQRPLPRRDDSRLMVLDRATGAASHSRFRELPDWLERGDLLVFNDTRVLPARLVGSKSSGGRVELLLVEAVGQREDNAQTWRCLLRASRPPVAGTMLTLAGELRATVLDRDAEGWRIRLVALRGSVDAALQAVGRMPLPPYIKRPDPGDPTGRALHEEDRARYQTVFAQHPGAVAAPTAGLHFTREVLEHLTRNGVESAYLTLHVGPGTFQPVRAGRVEDHEMHAERFVIEERTALAVRRARARGCRVVAVGTTVLRALEDSAADHGEVRAERRHCALFIYPGFEFRTTDALLTNFHLPRSTLLMLVSAFAGQRNVLAAYAQAIAGGYRFYSYGDAMLVRSTPR